MKRQHLIVGCGYVGLRVAQAWIAEGDRVTAVTRSAARAKNLSRLGLEPLVADITRPASLSVLSSLPACDTLLYAVGYDGSARAGATKDPRPDRREVFAGGLRGVLDHLSTTPGQVIYISSTGVYGETDGAWVDESTPVGPTREGGHACWAAEQVVQTHARAARATVLRLAGIYGPERVPRQKQILAGTPLTVAAEGYLNLIHVDDIVQTVLASAVNAHEGVRTFVVSDGHPVVRRAFYEEICRWLDCPLPPLVAPEPGQLGSQRSLDSKRVRSDRFRQILGVEMRYPDYRAGLEAIFAERSAAE